jgi:hypothetical protein
VQQRQGVVHRIVEQNGLAICEAKHKEDAGRARGKPVGIGHYCATVLTGYDRNAVAMNLMSGDNIPRSGVQLSKDPDVVLGNGRVIVAGIAAHI